MIKWRVLPLTIADQQQHIDYSETLLKTMAPNKPATLYWSMARPTGLVLGFSQKPDLLNQEELARQGMPVYHRRAGGTTVLVGAHLLGLDVLLSSDHPLILPDVVKSYRWLGEAWVQTLEQFGIQTRCIPPDEAHAQRELLKQPATSEREALLRRACYGSLSPYEVVVGQQKVVGLDMIRRRTGSLLQAGILLHWETDTIAWLLGQTVEEQSMLREGLLERAVGLDTLAGRTVTAAEVIEAFERVISVLE